MNVKLNSLSLLLQARSHDRTVAEQYMYIQLPWLRNKCYGMNNRLLMFSHIWRKSLVNVYTKQVCTSWGDRSNKVLIKTANVVWVVVLNMANWMKLAFVSLVRIPPEPICNKSLIMATTLKTTSLSVYVFMYNELIYSEDWLITVYVPHVLTWEEDGAHAKL